MTHCMTHCCPCCVSAAEEKAPTVQTPGCAVYYTHSMCVGAPPTDDASTCTYVEPCRMQSLCCMVVQVLKVVSLAMRIDCRLFSATRYYASCCSYGYTGLYIGLAAGRQLAQVLPCFNVTAPGYLTTLATMSRCTTRMLFVSSPVCLQ